MRSGNEHEAMRVVTYVRLDFWADVDDDDEEEAECDGRCMSSREGIVVVRRKER